MNLIERENTGQGIAFFNRLPTLGDRYPAQAQLRVQSPGLLEKVGLDSGMAHEERAREAQDTSVSSITAVSMKITVWSNQPLRHVRALCVAAKSLKWWTLSCSAMALFNCVSMKRSREVLRCWDKHWYSELSHHAQVLDKATVGSVSDWFLVIFLDFHPVFCTTWKTRSTLSAYLPADVFRAQWLP